MNDCTALILLPIVKIPLSQGKVAIINECDWPELAACKWYAVRNNNKWYAVHHKKKTDPLILMHRKLLGVSSLIDHRNGDGLDNRRSNMRPATFAENAANSKTPRNRWGYKGVAWCPKWKKWNAKISIGNKRKMLGWFDSPAEAGEAYKRAAISARGQFLNLSMA
jgi:AP2 domain.